MAPKKKKDKTQNRTSRIEIRLSIEELKSLTEKAESHGLNTSTYLRSLGMNYPIKSIVDRQAITALLKVNADLGKLGGLFKLWLIKNNGEKDPFSDQRTFKNIDELVDEIEALMKLMRIEAADLMGKV